MEMTVASPKETSGQGFAYEDKVVAWHLAWMLAGSAPYAHDPGRLVRLDCQIPASAQPLDDLLVTLSADGHQSRYAFSIKSNVQFKGCSAPSDFVERAWSVYLGGKTDVFDPVSDWLGMICVPQPEPVRSAIQSLLRKARRQEPDQLAQRLPLAGYASETERKLFQSFTCSATLASKCGSSSPPTGILLKRMTIVELDFEHSSSVAEATAVFVCQELVVDGSRESAIRLWNTLCQKAQQIRTAGGGVSREELMEEICHLFDLRDLPDFSADWRRLRAWYKMTVEVIPEKIGGVVPLDRASAVEELLSASAAHSHVVLIGSSGAGKTVVTKRVAEHVATSTDVLWFGGGRLRGGYVEAFAQHQGLGHPLQETLSHGRCRQGLVVIDGAERLREEDDLKEVAMLLTLLGMQRQGCTWRLVVTCRAEEWDRVQSELARHFGHRMEWNPVRLSLPDFDELSPVWETYPALRGLAVRPHLANLMQNPQILNILAIAFQRRRSGPDQPWMGEAEMVSWCWQSLVHTGSQAVARASLAQRIAEKEADSGVFDLPEADLSGDDLSVVAALGDILVSDGRTGTVTFVHDLLADWAKFQSLLSSEGSLATYLQERFANPHWHSAIRLYGISLLEADATAAKWKATIERLPNVADLLLESLVFSGNALQLLERAWPVLCADDGRLLRTLVRRFLHVATIPNSEIMALARQFKMTDADARILERLPLWMYWLGPLRCFATHVEEMVRFVPVDTARIAKTWLRYTPKKWPGRKDAAILAVAVARCAYRERPYYHSSESDGQLPYQAMLEAYPDAPEQVQQLALKAVWRVAPDPDDGEAFKHYDPPGTVTIVQSPFDGGEYVTQEPWPDGPLGRVDDAFRKACLETDALKSVMAANPALATEIMLALLIRPRPPHVEHDYHHSYVLPEERVGLENDFSFNPRFYTRGPFLLFLRVNADEAIKAIVHLVDFATTRWMESSYKGDWQQVGVRLEISAGGKLFVGNARVYHWYHGFGDSNIVTSALMAIEKWLYERIDAKDDPDGWITLILNEAKSLAFVGLLSEIGRYTPTLFAGVLRPLLLAAEPYYFETAHAAQGGLDFGTPASFHEGEWFYTMAHDWDTMKHRRIRLVDVAAFFFHKHKETRAALTDARERWRASVKVDSDERWRQYVERLAESFEPKNWKEVTLDDGSTGLAFQMPAHLEPTAHEMEKLNRDLLLTTLPIQCWKLLKEGTPLSEDQIPGFLDQAKQLVGFEVTESDIGTLQRLVNAICGTIAVLAVLNRDWLRRNPSAEKWCINTLRHVLENPPAWDQFDIPESVGDFTWEHFACDVAPVFWAETPADETWRRIVVQLAMAKHYGAAGKLMRRAFEKRGQLGDSFWQLVAFVLDWAQERHDIRDSRFSGKKVDFSKWMATATRRFVRSKYATDVSKWGITSVERGNLSHCHNHPQYHGKGKVDLLCRWPRLDGEQMRYAFSGIFLPNQAQNASELQKFLDFWDQALLTSLDFTRSFDGKGNPISEAKTEAGFPLEYHNWVLDGLAVVVGQLPPLDRPERYWQPILGLGPRAEHWVGRFLSHWFMDARKRADPKFFVCRWKEMIDYCLQDPAWTTDKTWFARNTPSLWLHLIGLPGFVESLWTDEDSGIVAEAAGRLVQIAPFILHSARDAVRLLSWLAGPVAEGVRVPILGPIWAVAEQASDYWWEERHLLTVMSRLLCVLWDKHRLDCGSSTDTGKRFRKLLHVAATRQEPIALDLQSRIASRETGFS